MPGAMSGGTRICFHVSSSISKGSIGRSSLYLEDFYEECKYDSAGASIG